MAGAEEPPSHLYRVLLDRFRGLEASHQKLKEQFQVLQQHKAQNNDRDLVPSSRSTASFPCWADIPGAFFYGSPYRSVLEHLGHAVHVHRIASGEIIYWNPAAEKLYGYKACEVVGRSVSQLHLEEEHHLSTLDIIDKLSHGLCWSGQLPIRKRSGQIFMAMVTKSLLYEDDELDAIVTVSSDAAIFNSTSSGNSRSLDEQFSNCPRNLKINRLPQPRIASVPHIAASVSNLASKVLSRKRGDATCGTCRNALESEDGDMEIHDMKADKPPRVPAVKLFSRSHVASGLLDENIQQNGFDDNLRKDKGAYEACYHRDSAKSAYQGNVPNGRSSFQLDGREFQGNVSNGRSLDSEDVSPMQSQRIPNSGKNVGSVLSRNDSDSHMVVNSEIRWEDLQLREEIGQGSFAVVYRGIWNGSDVAVKVYFSNQYTEKTLLDYKKEIDIMRRLRHPNVLLFMGAVCTEEKLAIVTEYLTRGSLFKTLHRNNQSLDIRRRLKMAIDVARGMNYLHHRNPPIVHRDLKSSNLLVDKSWTVKVGDFGLSKLKNATFLTAKSGRGTPQWMAPEVLRNDPSTEKSDVFSYGVILWELMTERIPWNDLNSLQVVGVVGFMDRRLDLPESIDPQVSTIISDCWRSIPEDRPSFEEIIHRMTELVHAGGRTASAAPP